MTTYTLQLNLIFIIFTSFFYLKQSVFGEPSVIIIGAGPAGIAAATKLHENSITNITIFEAENRIGGRIHSLQFGDTIVDLGAQYCHGEKNNLAYELAKNFNILKPGLRGFQNHNVYNSNGSKLNPKLVTELYNIYTDYNHETPDEKTSSLGDFIAQRKIPNNDIDKLRFLEGFIVIHEGAFSWYDVSANSDYQKCEGNQALTWGNLGYKTVLDIMLNQSKSKPIQNKIYLNTKVKKINWNQNQVITSNGNFSADYIIFSGSIGILKKSNKLFYPELNSEKLKAIEATGFGGVIKFFVKFSKQWWLKQDEVFSFFWQNKDVEQLEKSNVWISQIRYILKVPDNPLVWVGWISGDLVPEIEKLSINDFRFGFRKVLGRFLGQKYNVSQISNLLRSNWVTNENFGGTYSYTRAGFYNKNKSYQNILDEPLYNSAGKPVLLFAGEATNPVHYSTVHGAIETGYREADRIINKEKNK